MIKLLRPFEQTGMASRLSLVMLAFHFYFISCLLVVYFSYYDGELFFYHFVAFVYTIFSSCALFVSVVPMLSVDYHVMLFDKVYDKKFERINKPILFLSVIAFSIFEVITYFVLNFSNPDITFALSLFFTPFYAVIVFCFLL